MTSSGDELLAGMEDFGLYVTFTTGLRQQFIDAGWSQRGAEEMVRAAVIAKHGR